MYKMCGTSIFVVRCSGLLNRGVITIICVVCGVNSHKRFSIFHVHICDMQINRWAGIFSGAQGHYVTVLVDRAARQCDGRSCELLKKIAS